MGHMNMQDNTVRGLHVRKRSKVFRYCIMVSFLFVTSMIMDTALTWASSKQQTASGSVAGSNPQSTADAAPPRIMETYGKLPLYFIRNDGQMAEEVKFYEKGSGHAAFFTGRGVTWSLTGKEETETSSRDEEGYKAVTVDGTDAASKRERQRPERSTHNTATPQLITLVPLSAKKHPEIVAEGQQECKVNYLIGNDPAKWKIHIPTYQSVVYRELYKGIDMKFYGNNRQMEYDIIVKPGASPSRVQLSYEGVEDVRIHDNGNMEIVLGSSLKEGAQRKLGNEKQPPESFHNTNGGLPLNMRKIVNKRQPPESPFVKGEAGESRERSERTILQKKPYVYQIIDGKKVEIEGKFRVLSAGHGDKNRKSGANSGWNQTKNQTSSFLYGFTVASYDKRYPLVIDPTLVYSTYLGGSDSDFGFDIAVDGVGNAYVTGETYSSDFPTKDAMYGTRTGGYDVFVTKIDASGASLSYSTYLGGSYTDYGHSIAVDSAGNAYVTGWTRSSDFPTKDAIYGSHTAMYGGHSGNDYDAFVTKIDASGASLSYSTYLGGSYYDGGYSIAVDSTGNAYVTGRTYSTDFPTKNAIDGSLNGASDAFVTKLAASGASLSYSTYLGGSDWDYGSSIAVDGAGNASVTGYTGSSDFPTKNAIDGSLNGASDAFVTKLDALGASLSYSTYLGGSSFDEGYGIAVDGAGNAYVTGNTGSSDFPTENAMYESFNGGVTDAFVTKLDASGTSISFSTYLGGNDSDWGMGIAVDSAGNAYVTGETYSSDFPTANAIDGSLSGRADAFVTKLATSGASLSYSTYLGGSDHDAGHGIAVDSAGNAYVTGVTYSSDFPTANAMYGTNTGSFDAFVAKIDADATPTPVATPTPSSTVTSTPDTPTPMPTVTSTPGTPTPTPSPTPEPCKPKKLKIRPKSLKLARGTSVQKTVTLTCKNGLPSANRLVKAKIVSGKKHVTVSPTTIETDENGQATFTITATEKTGKAVVRFKYKNLIRDVTVKVKKK
ncbi:MAG: SBBP repeat-containing protein [Candidatus Brocadiaceae bacterium]|nr:SBBP repeat-containing protein [Candidatus Brocadiaceae bacterium]